jgi:putative ABC transport system permease protein
MTKLFGIPVGALVIVLVGTLAVALAVVAALALRNRVFLRLGVRNVPRRRGRSALIVVGLMLGTAIITAALATGDTMSHTIRSSAVAALGQTDEVVAAKGVSSALAVDSGATGARYFPAPYADRIARITADSGLVDGVAPVIVEPVAVQDVSSRQNEPRVTLFASDPARLGGLGEMRSGGDVVSLADLGPGEVYLNAEAADELDARAGDTIRILVGRGSETATVKAIVRYEGGATPDSGLLMPLTAAQDLLGREGLVKAVFVSNRGGSESGAELSDQVIRLLAPTLAPLGLEADNTKQDALKQADEAGNAFMSFFTTFGSFSIAAGILLIFLIFVMLAAERRGELGIARAVGTRRGHLVQMFLFEGLAYDLVAAAVGALAGVVVAYGMVLVMASAFATTGDLDIAYAVRPSSVVLAYTIGVLLTLGVVAFSAWRVSRMNITAAIRNLSEPSAQKKGRRRWLLGLLGTGLGVLLVISGASSEDAVTLSLGVALVILSLVPLAHHAGVPDRAARTAAGLVLVVYFVLPTNRWLFGDLKTNFSIFILAGLAIVIGASWTIMYNADVLLGALRVSLGRFRPLAPVLKMSMAYPLRSRFRTGVTLAMFMLVVFTLVVGAITTGSFVGAFNDVRSYGGGFDVRATASPAAPIGDMREALAAAPGVEPAEFRVVASESSLPVRANQLGAEPEDYVIHGFDDAFLGNTSYRLAARANGYADSAAVWEALRTRPDLAIVDATVVPRRSTFVGAVVPKFRLSGFYLEDKTFAPVRVEVRDPQTGAHVQLTVIGVLAETAPQDMTGIFAAQSTVGPVFGNRVDPTTYLFALRPGVDAEATAKKLESAFLRNGMQADAYSTLLQDNVSASLTFDRLIMGFMGLGLIVGVAALGVISARSVVERRQQIGVLRAIGFRTRMVQLSFLLESSFIALTSIVIGTLLGLALAFNVIVDSRRTPSWQNMDFEVPWLTLGVIFFTVYAVALATTFIPARRASRVYPAEALRYQ